MFDHEGMHPTLFGGDVTGFAKQFGPRLFEAVYRVENDPAECETRHIALAEMEYLMDVADAYGLGEAEFVDLVENLPAAYARDTDGELFIETKEGSEVYFGHVIVTAMPGPAV